MKYWCFFSEKNPKSLFVLFTFGVYFHTSRIWTVNILCNILKSVNHKRDNNFGFEQRRTYLVIRMDSTSTTATEKGEDVELDDESVDENGARSNILLHLMVVGFHHKKGCQVCRSTAHCACVLRVLFTQVEYCYPPLDSSRVSVEQSESSQDTNDEGDKCRKETVRLPVVWQTLPSLALPDGSHNHQDDTVLFHLPDTEDPTRSVFGVACYRQVSSNVSLPLSNPIPSTNCTLLQGSTSSHAGHNPEYGAEKCGGTNP